MFRRPLFKINAGQFRFLQQLTPEQGRRELRYARQQLINRENDWFKRQKLRIRLAMLGQIRPMKTDDIMALVSWIFVGTNALVLASTTFVASILLFLVNSFSFEGKINYFLLNRIILPAILLTFRIFCKSDLSKADRVYWI